MLPRVSWMEKVVKEDPQYKETETQVLHVTEEVLGESLKILRLYNRSEGLHTLQGKYGCERSAEGRISGRSLYGYDGTDFITFDTENLTWEALNAQARITQEKWDVDTGYKQRKKFYLEEICIKWLDKYLSYQKEALQRAEPQVVTMINRTEVEDGMERHVCRVHGFYPREINASWTRDGEVWLQDTFHGFLAPNADGTYHYWISIRVDPKERGRYRCRVDHNSLLHPLDLELKEPTNSEPNLGLIIGFIVADLILLFVIVGIRLFLKRRQSAYKAALKRLHDNYKKVPIIGGRSESSVIDGRSESSASLWSCDI
ncbi:class I histocompatibility antigen, F10 alpha chain-like isoform X2 [Erythrolamprus reginae]|uniref:class I histocompatibility antigen, F10 alpha chain-like isoform X2 n=1 Tax=Erythrolamprus reginae TaxID=121349 RepID=UPI00396CCBDD